MSVFQNLKNTLIYLHSNFVVELESIDPHHAQLYRELLNQLLYEMDHSKFSDEVLGSPDKILCQLYKDLDLMLSTEKYASVKMALFDLICKTYAARESKISKFGIYKHSIDIPSTVFFNFNNKT